MTKKAKPVSVPVVVRMPKPIVAAIDRAAKKNSRSRSKEVLYRMQQSLAGQES